MKLFQKLLLGFACVALLVSCVGYAVQQTNQRVLREIDRLSVTSVAELTAAGDMARGLRESAYALRAAMSATNGTDHDEATASLQTALDDVDLALVAARSASSAGRSQSARWRRTDAVARQDQKLSLIEELAAAFNAYRGASEELATSPVARSSVSDLLAERIEPHFVTVSQPLERYRRAAQQDVLVGAADARRELTQADRFLFVAVLLGIGLTLVLGVLIANSIAAPLQLLREATHTLGRGRFDHRVSLNGSREVNELAEALNRMAEELGATTVSKRFLNNILESMSDPLLVLDDAGRIILANSAVARILGYELDELHGESAARLLADGQEAVARILTSARLFGGTGNLEMRLLSRERIEIPVVISGAVMTDEDGDILGFVCVAKDITEQKLVEHELILARRRAEEMARLKSSFLANMSHEIRTPLTGIIGSAQVLAGMSSGESLEMAEVIERASLRLLQTINSVLDMARIEAGELKPSIEPVNLAEEIHDAVGVLERLARDKALTIEVRECVSDVHAAVDPAFIHRIVTNLVGNAIKFTREGGIIVEIDVENEHTAVLRVRDTGIGISDGFLPHLFAEFRQESSGIQRTYEGTGLGLAITHRLVELLDASIDVQSTKGEGTTFTVRLTRCEAQSTSRPRHASQAVA